ncbi:hypothetical protein OnM2_03432 [Erysiphe neolycopersici]|uniref:Uncharacterized protein n=1 Tax=Erysiphe neolycopersici TaxID=212602 RepID=A0A420I079_9PEZI|nr:hypothetical protein OnM2_03432 [Erysiphe neolycopersici]
MYSFKIIRSTSLYSELAFLVYAGSPCQPYTKDDGKNLGQKYETNQEDSMIITTVYVNYTYQ